MELVGSRTELEFEKELQRSHECNFSEKSESKLKVILEGQGIDVSKAYILYRIPEQGEDSYLVFTGGETLLNIEVAKDDNKAAPIIEHIAVKDYKKGLRKIDQIKLLIAQKLANA